MADWTNANNYFYVSNMTYNWDDGKYYDIYGNEVSQDFAVAITNAFFGQTSESNALTVLLNNMPQFSSAQIENGTMWLYYRGEPTVNQLNEQIQFQITAVDVAYGQNFLYNGITSQEAAYGITALGLSISGKTELFRLLEGSENLPKYFKGASKLSMSLGFVGLGVTTLDGFTNSNGWQNHHYADLMIQGSMLTIATFFPGIGWVVAGGYFLGDLYFQHNHNGQSISEYYFDEP